MYKTSKYIYLNYYGNITFRKFRNLLSKLLLTTWCEWTFLDRCAKNHTDDSVR